MSIKILMPALSPTMKEGILQKWLVKVGDEIKAGDLIAEIETDKATMEVEAVDEGKITNILVEEGAEPVSVNSVIAILDGSADDIEINNKEATQRKKFQNDIESKTEEKNSIDVKKNFLSAKALISKKNLKSRASPYAKKLAKDRNIELESIIGTGPKGRIIKRDFENIEAENNQILSFSNYKTLEPSSIRKIIAERTTQTKNTVPHFYLTIESEVDSLLKLRKYINSQYADNKVSINDILVKALAIAQYKNPQTNVSWFSGRIIQYSSVDVSVAVALKEGLITPVVKNAHIKGLLEISKEIKILSAKAKQGKLTPDQYQGGTISISNLGMYGISEFTAIINPPQSSILAVGTIKETPKVEGKEIKNINILKSTLSADHRVLDGAVAAKLLKDFNDIIENPFELWLQSKDMEIL